MANYYITILLILLFIALSSRSRGAMGDAWLFLAVLLLFLFSAFREGFTPDYDNYYNAFEDASTVLLNERYNKEILFKVMATSLSYRWALVIQSFLICCCLYIVLRIYVPKSYRVVSCLIFFLCTSFYLGNISGYRSSFVTIGFFFAMYLKNERKRGWILGLLLMIATSLIHQSGWLMVPFLLMSTKPLSKPLTRILLVLSIVIIFISLFAANTLNTFVNNSIHYMEEYEYYMEAEISNTIALGTFTIVRLLLLLFLFFYSFRCCTQNVSQEELLFVKLTTVFFLLNLLPGIGLIGRFRYYFAFVSIVGFATMLKHEKNIKLRYVFIFAFLFYSIWEFYLLAISPNYLTYYSHYKNILFN